MIWFVSQSIPSFKFNPVAAELGITVKISPLAFIKSSAFIIASLGSAEGKSCLLANI